jgi:ribulose-phosphate 3-epimerase
MTDIEIAHNTQIENIDRVIEAGANIIVAGSAVFNGDAGQNVTDFLEHMA